MTSCTLDLTDDEARELGDWVAKLQRSKTPQLSRSCSSPSITDSLLAKIRRALLDADVVVS